MADESSGKKGGGGLLGCVGVVVVLVILACCCGCGLAFFSPGILATAFARMLVTDEPAFTGGPAFDPNVAAATVVRVCSELGTSGTTRVSGAELTQVMLTPDPDASTPNAVRYLSITTEADRLGFQTSLEDEQGGYVNISMRLGFTLEEGVFTALKVDELTVGSLTLGSFLAGQDLSLQANSNLGARDVNSTATVNGETFDLTQIHRMTVEDGALSLTVDPTVVGTWEACQKVAGQAPPPPAEGAEGDAATQGGATDDAAAGSEGAAGDGGADEAGEGAAAPAEPGRRPGGPAGRPRRPR